MISQRRTFLRDNWRVKCLTRSIEERLTFLVVVIVSVEDLPIAGVAVRVFSDDVRPRVLLVLQRAG